MLHIVSAPLTLLGFCSVFLSNPTTAAPPPSTSRIPPRVPYFIQRNPNVPSLNLDDDGSLSLVYTFPPSEVPILPQAVGGILVQSLVQLYRESGPSPDGLRDNFSHQIFSKGAFCPTFNAEFSITAAPSPGSSNGNGPTNGTSTDSISPGEEAALFALTNARVVDVLELLGFDFAHTQSEDVMQLKETAFEVYVSYKTQGRRRIGGGYVANAKAPPLPVGVGAQANANALSCQAPASVRLDVER